MLVPNENWIILYENHNHQNLGVGYECRVGHPWLRIYTNGGEIHTYEQQMW